MAQLTLDIWSDIACPWCYVGKRRIEGALARFAHRDAVAVTWRSFELDPSAPRELALEVPMAERLARKYGTSAEEAQRMMDRMTGVAAQDGLEFRFDRIRPGNTFDAHRLLHLAREHEKQDELEERFFRAYLSEGERIGDRETLVRLAGEVGLEVDRARGVLESDAFAAEVREDQAQAAAYGIHGVPFFVLAGRLGVSGAQPVETLTRVLEEAWAEVTSAAPDAEQGAVCGPDGCA